eukprot:27708-Chlamydomonas_euryale.AAC.10
MTASSVAFQAAKRPLPCMRTRCCRNRQTTYSRLSANAAEFCPCTKAILSDETALATTGFWPSRLCIIPEAALEQLRPSCSAAAFEDMPCTWCIAPVMAPPINTTKRPHGAKRLRSCAQAALLMPCSASNIEKNSGFAASTSGWTCTFCFIVSACTAPPILPLAPNAATLSKSGRSAMPCRWVLPPRAAGPMHAATMYDATASTAPFFSLVNTMISFCGSSAAICAMSATMVRLLPVPGGPMTTCIGQEWSRSVYQSRLMSNMRKSA